MDRHGWSDPHKEFSTTRGGKYVPGPWGTVVGVWRGSKSCPFFGHKHLSWKVHGCDCRMAIPNRRWPVMFGARFGMIFFVAWICNKRGGAGYVVAIFWSLSQLRRERWILEGFMMKNDIYQQYITIFFPSASKWPCCKVYSSPKKIQHDSPHEAGWKCWISSPPSLQRCSHPGSERTRFEFRWEAFEILDRATILQGKGGSQWSGFSAVSCSWNHGTMGCMLSKSTVTLLIRVPTCIGVSVCMHLAQV